MRIKFELDLVNENIKLPINYNWYLRDLIFSLVSEKLEDFQPDKGEPFEKKHFSRFNFSKIFGDFEIIKEINNQKNLLFKGVHFNSRPHHFCFSFRPAKKYLTPFYSPQVLAPASNELLLLRRKNT